MIASSCASVALLSYASPSVATVDGVIVELADFEESPKTILTQSLKPSFSVLFVDWNLDNVFLN